MTENGGGRVGERPRAVAPARSSHDASQAAPGADLFAEIIALSPAAIAVLDGPEHRYSVMNAAYRTLARGKGQVLGRTFAGVWPEAGTGIVEVLDRVFETAEPYRAEGQPFHVVRDRGPETIWLTFSFLPMRGRNGVVSRILAMANEVTDHVRALEAAERMAAQLAASNELSSALSGAFTRAEVARAVLAKGLALLGADAGTLAVVPEDAPDFLELVDQLGYPAALVEAWRRFPLSLPSPMADAARDGSARFVAAPEDAAARYPRWAAAVVDLPDRAWAAVPLVARGRVLGALGLSYYAPRTFDAEYRAQLESVAERCALALDRATALDAARRRTVELEATLAAVPVPVFIARDALATRIEANAAGQELLGLAPGENPSLNQPAGERPPYMAVRDGRPLAVDELPLRAAARFGRETSGFGYEVVRRDGTVRHVVANARPIVDAEGVRRGAVGAVLDVTDRDRAEALGDALGVIHLLVHSSHDIVGILRSAIQAACAALGAETAAVSLREGEHWVVRHVFGLPDTALGARMSDDEEPHALLAIRERRPIAIADCWNDARTNQEHMRRWNVRSVLVVPMVVRDEPLGVAYFNYHRANRPLGPVEEDFGAKLGAALSLALENARLFRELADSDRRKSEFLAILSHELRNPLAPIRNAIHLLERAGSGSSESARATAILRRQTDHLTRLVDDLLDVTRISRGKIALHRSRLDLREVARRTVEDLRPVVEESGVSLRFEDGAGPLWVDADPTRVAQVIGNLLQNAAKFTPARGHVVLAIDAVDGAARLVVRDDGMGMEPGDVERMFEPFAQAEAGLARTNGGLGLGLALVKALVELHGGTVVARSDGPGRGSEFTAILPLAEEPAARPVPTPAPVPGGRLVLVVEDNPDAARTLADVLELQGHRVLIAGDGAGGLALAREARPDVVLCDIGLPDMDGFAVARALRADPALRGTRLVALSGYALPEDRARAREAGFDAHLAKPASIEELARLLRP